MNEFNSPWITPFQRMRGIFFRHYYLWARNPNTFSTPSGSHCRGFHLGICFSLFKPDRHSAQSHPFFFLGAIILWTVLRRGQHEITFSLMEDAWSRNLQNIVMTPVNMVEYFAASILFGVIKLCFELVLMGVLISLFFGFNVSSWTLTNSLCVEFAADRLGHRSLRECGHHLFWPRIGGFCRDCVFRASTFLLCIFIRSRLFQLGEPIAKAFPATWIFEGMRAVSHLSTASPESRCLLVCLEWNFIWWRVIWCLTK